MKARQCWFTNKMVFGGSIVTCFMPVARTSKSFVNEHIHTTSIKITALSYNAAVININ